MAACWQRHRFLIEDLEFGSGDGLQSDWQSSRLLPERLLRTKLNKRHGGRLEEPPYSLMAHVFLQLFDDLGVQWRQRSSWFRQVDIARTPPVTLVPAASLP